MIISRYLVKETLLTFFAVSGLLYIIFLSHRLILFLSEALSGVLPVEVVLQLVLLKSVKALMIVLPLSFYLAILIALGRLYRDYEMVALNACGIGPRTVVGTIMLLATAFSLVIGLFSFQITPWAEYQSRYVKVEAVSLAQVSSVKPGRFVDAANGRLVFYAQRATTDGEQMENIMIDVHSESGMDLFTAERAFQVEDEEGGGRFFILKNGYRYQGNVHEGEFTATRYDEYAIRIEDPEVVLGHRKLDEMTVQQLRDLDSAKAQAELQWRLAMPISAFLLALLAVALSRSDPRQGRYGKLFVAILVYVAFSNLLALARSWIERGVVPAELGLWWVHALIALLIVLMLWRYVNISWRGAMLRLMSR